MCNVVLHLPEAVVALAVVVSSANNFDIFIYLPFLICVPL